MKRNKTNNRLPRSGQSPYERHEKTPYKYVALRTVDEVHAETKRIQNRTYGKFAARA